MTRPSGVLEQTEQEKRERIVSSEAAKRRLMQVSIVVKLMLAKEGEQQCSGVSLSEAMQGTRLDIPASMKLPTRDSSQYETLYQFRKHSAQSASTNTTTLTETTLGTNSSCSPMMVASVATSLAGSPQWSPAGSPSTKSILVSRNRSASPRNALLRKVSFSLSAPLFADAVGVRVESEHDTSSSPDDLPLLP